MTSKGPGKEGTAVAPTRVDLDSATAVKNELDARVTDVVSTR